MTQAATIINRAAEILGYKDPQEALSGDDSQNFLGVLNAMVDARALDSLFVYATTYLVQSVSGNPIAIGTGATLNTPRPVRIPEGGFFRIGGKDYGFRMVSRAEYADEMLKATASTFPDVCYYEADAPTGALYFYPALRAAAELHLPIEERVSEFASLTTDYSLTPGVRAALEYSLAEELAPGRRPLDPQIQRLAMRYRRALRSVNVRVPDLIDEHSVNNQSPLRPA